MEKQKDYIDIKVDNERIQQNKKWGQQNHPNSSSSWESSVYLATNYRVRCDTAAKNKRLTWEDILLEEVYEALAEREPTKIREELIQTMAVCKAWIECLDRKSNG